MFPRLRMRASELEANIKDRFLQYPKSLHLAIHLFHFYKDYSNSLDKRCSFFYLHFPLHTPCYFVSLFLFFSHIIRGLHQAPHLLLHLGTSCISLCAISSFVPITEEQAENSECGFYILLLRYYSQCMLTAVALKY